MELKTSSKQSFRLAGSREGDRQRERSPSCSTELLNSGGLTEMCYSVIKHIYDESFLGE